MTFWGFSGASFPQTCGKRHINIKFIQKDDTLL